MLNYNFTSILRFCNNKCAKQAHSISVEWACFLYCRHLQTCVLIRKRELPQVIFSNGIPGIWYPNPPRQPWDGCYGGSTLGVGFADGDDQEPVGHVHGDDFGGGDGDFDGQDGIVCRELYRVAGGAGVGDAGDDEEVVVLEKGVVIALAGVFQDLGSGFLQELLQGRLILQVDKGKGTGYQVGAWMAGHQVFQGGLRDVLGPDDLGFGGGGGGGLFRLRLGGRGDQQVSRIHGAFHWLPGHIRFCGRFGAGVLRWVGTWLIGWAEGPAAGKGQHQSRRQAEGGEAGQFFSHILLFHRIPSQFWCWTGMQAPAFVNPDGFFRLRLRVRSKIAPLT